ncbi:retinoid-inducible serine carboxypeptidase-like [Lytechinus variegatus]|uniref:retinoid-inducible serine carboxypeptidase-like n=1 Tax=Lytechinus variegatus TaxID=7654 RepID=UPI001BB239D2|nr:retinoid-inducible serine carboxypeptidase-like [Lytechinus variegatus]
MNRLLPSMVGIIVLLLIQFVNAAPSNNCIGECKHGYKEPKQDWGYVGVRPNANMFWWLYYSTQQPFNSDIPLVLWLQGGPGGSSTGFGNFQEIGPLDVNQNPRNTTWVSVANVLFIDNPVGTGYSYVTDSSAYTTNVSQIADDLVTCITAFFNKLPQFQTTPFYIFSESYGGKMTAAFSQKLLQAIDAGKVKSDFKGFAMGDSWISPVDYVMTWGPYLRATSLLDTVGFGAVQNVAEKTKEAFDQGNYSQATDLWGEAESVIEEYSDDVNFYNILEHNVPDQAVKSGSPLERLRHRHLDVYANDALSELMNGSIKKKLGIPDSVVWGGQSGEVFTQQSEDFMKPVISIVDDLITNSNLRVIVYNGQLDLICDTPGTELWVQKLTWPGLAAFNTTRWTPEYVPSKEGDTAYFFKSHENFAFFWIMKAGHMVPADAGEAALMMLKAVITE